MASNSAIEPVRKVFARAFCGEGGVIEPSQKAIIIAVLLGMFVGAVLNGPSGAEANTTAAAAAISPDPSTPDTE